MSFDGFYRILCQNGHFHSGSCYLYDAETWRCPDCEAPRAWDELIDQTNGYNEEDEYKLELLQEAVVHTCEHCEQRREVQPARYKIPTPEETEISLHEEEIYEIVTAWVEKEHPGFRVHFMEIFEQMDGMGDLRGAVRLKRK
jgi:hypothetical protein